MSKRYQGIVGLLFRLVDACVIVAAWLFAYFLRFDLIPFLPLPAGRPLPPFATYAALAPLVAVLWLAVFDASHLYESRRLSGLPQELLQLIRAHGLALLYFSALLQLFEQGECSRLVMLYFALLAAAAISLCRCGVRIALRARLRHDQRCGLTGLGARAASRARAQQGPATSPGTSA